LQFIVQHGNIISMHGFSNIKTNFFRIFMDFSENSPGCDVPELSEITVRRSSRCRRIGVKIKNDRSIELTAPENTPEKVLLETYAKFKPWLASQLEKLAGLPEEDQAYKFEFKVGGRFFFCGKSYELQKAEKSGASVITLHEDCLLTPSEMPGSIKLMLEAFYRRHARRLITGKLEEYSRKFGFAMPQININGARGRFGSCNSRKELNFSWHLAMYPMELIELVILHECAHFREMNHSPSFYRVLAEYLPDHRQRSKELDKWSRKLSLYPR